MFTCLSEGFDRAPLSAVSLYHAGMLRAGRQADWVLLHLFLDFKDGVRFQIPRCTQSLILLVAPSSSLSVVLPLALFFLAHILFMTLSSCFQPYNQKEPPVVRVVEGPLFSEVVAHYQHFQQTIRIHNVPGNKATKLHNGISSNGFL